MKELLLATVLALSPVQAGVLSPVQASVKVKVYFAKGYGIPGSFVPVTRTAPGRDVATFAIQQLIAGPTAAERRRSCITGRE